MLEIKRISLGLSLGILFSIAASGAEFHPLDCSRDPNGCQVQVALKESEFNKYSIGRQIFQVLDPKVDNTAHNALIAHTCDVFPKKGRLIAKLEFPVANNWKIRALNAFMGHVTNEHLTAERETVYAWVKQDQDDVANKLLTSRFGFKVSNTKLHYIGFDTGLVGTTDIGLPEEMIQLEANATDILLKWHEINGQ